MILTDISVLPYTIAKPTSILIDLKADTPSFPLYTIDRDSYIVRAMILTGIDHNVQAGIHSIQIGRYCSISDGVSFMLNPNHDYLSVTTSVPSFLRGTPIKSKISRRGQILIQNDVWVGHGATIMAGVTLHNGSVVATDSVVTKDVPPYAIVGGNPARIIKYRFEKHQIDSLQEIAWWYWDDEKLVRNKDSFNLGMNEFLELHGKNPEKDKKIPSINIVKDKLTYLFFLDFSEPHPVYEKVIRSYCAVFGDNPDVRLLLYLPKDADTEKNLASLDALANKCYSGNGDILVHLDNLVDERPLFTVADYYVTSRAFDTVKRTCLADQIGTIVISGIDEPVFGSFC